METITINTHPLKGFKTVDQKKESEFVIIRSDTGMCGSISFDGTIEIWIPKSIIFTQPTSLEDRMRLRHACIQMAIEANLVKSDGSKRNINEVALEFYNFIVK
jgi:hypothetical protein